jgi:hypothetical protein
MDQSIDAPTIIVFQMGKVASIAWSDAIKAALPGAETYHLHHLNPAAVEAFRSRLHRTGEAQTMQHIRALEGQVDHISAGHQAKFGDGRWTEIGKLQIITGIREPVDRSISGLFYLADFIGHRNLALSFRQKASVDVLAQYFTDMWRQSLSGRLPTTSFEEEVCDGFLQYRNWFDRELNEIFHLDVTHRSFDFERRCLTLSQGNLELFCYRFEDLKEGSEAWEKLSASVSGFLGAAIPGLPKSNTTQNRRARDHYAAFRKQITLPDDMLEEIYSAPILRVFYSADELDGFKLRWRARR